MAGFLDQFKQRISKFFAEEIPQFSKYLPYKNKLIENDLISLEISDDYIKFLKIRRNQQSYCIENFDMISLATGMVVKNEIKDILGIAKILREKFKKYGIKTKNIILATNYSTIITKSINISNRLTTDEIENRVWREAGNLFPNIIKEIYLDYVVLGKSPQDETQLEILVVACRKVHIKPYIDIIRFADLDLKVIDVNCYALERSLTLMRQQVSHKTFALLNIGFSTMTLLIILEDKLNYIYELVYDGHGLLQYLQRNSENTEKNEMSELLHRNLSIHLKHTMQYFYTSRPNIRIEHIMLSGDCAALIPDLVQFIQAETGKQTILSNPLVEMTFASHFDDANKNKFLSQASAFMQCCGLSLYKLH